VEGEVVGQGGRKVVGREDLLQGGCWRGSGDEVLGFSEGGVVGFSEFEGLAVCWLVWVVGCKVGLLFALRAEVPPETHRDGAGGELGQSGEDDDLGVTQSGKAGGQGEGNGQAVG